MTALSKREEASSGTFEMSEILVVYTARYDSTDYTYLIRDDLIPFFSKEKLSRLKTPYDSGLERK